MKKVSQLYDEVLKYKRPDWTLAAFYRRGLPLERLGQTIIETPVPPEVKRPGRGVAGRLPGPAGAQIAQRSRTGRWTVYGQAIARRARTALQNEWTKKTLESLDRFRPKEYPVLKEAKVRMMPEDLSPAPLADSPDGPTRRPASEPVPQVATDTPTK